MADQLKTERVEIRVTKDFLALVDAARGDVSRTRWIERALEAALDAEGLPSEEAYRRVRDRKPPEAPPERGAPLRSSSVLPPRAPQLRAQPKPFTPPRPKGGK